MFLHLTLSFHITSELTQCNINTVWYLHNVVPWLTFLYLQFYLFGTSLPSHLASQIHPNLKSFHFSTTFETFSQLRKKYVAQSISYSCHKYSLILESLSSSLLLTNPKRLHLDGTPQDQSVESNLSFLAISWLFIEINLKPHHLLLYYIPINILYHFIYHY